MRLAFGRSYAPDFMISRRLNLFLLTARGGMQSGSTGGSRKRSRPVDFTSQEGTYTNNCDLP